MSKAIQVCSGNAVKMHVNGSDEQFTVKPVVAQDALGQFGVGVLIEKPDGIVGWTWGLIGPRLLIQSWRAMKIIELLPRIDVQGMLCYCWYLAAEELHTRYDEMPEEFARIAGLDPEALLGIRAEAIAAFPGSGDLDAMLKIVEAHDLRVSLQEIERCRKELKPEDEVLIHLHVFDDQRRERLRLKTEARSNAAARVPKSDSATPKRRRGWLSWLGV